MRDRTGQGVLRTAAGRCASGEPRRIRRLAAVLLGGWVATAAACGLASGQEREDGDPSIARMDELWSQRNRSGAPQELVAVGSQALQAHPNAYDVEWRVARAYFWVAYTQPNRVQKKAMAAEAMEWADRARTERPDRVEGHYVYAVSAGAYAGSIDVMRAAAAGLAGKVEAAALRAYAIDPDYEDGAPGTVLGRYYFELPWPLRDLGRSRRYLEEVVARHPRKLTARDYLADTYYALGERERARAELVFVLASDLPPGAELDFPPPKAVAREELYRWFPGASADGVVAAP